MSRELRARGQSGSTKWGYLLSSPAFNSQYFNTATPGWENFNASNLASYQIALTEDAGTGGFFATIPKTGNARADVLSFLSFTEVSPGTMNWVNDAQDITPQQISWNGTAVSLSLASTSANATNSGVAMGTVPINFTGLTPSAAWQFTGYVANSNNSGIPTFAVAAPSDVAMSWQIWGSQTGMGTKGAAPDTLLYDGASAVVAALGGQSASSYPINAGKSINYDFRPYPLPAMPFYYFAYKSSALSVSANGSINGSN